MSRLFSVSHATFAASMLLAASASFAQSITVYTAGPGGLIKQLAAGFETETGIKVDVFQATTGKVLARLEAEAANPRADVLISASWDTAVDLDARGWLAPHQSANAAKVAAAYKSENYVAQGISALGIIWNKASGKPAPRDWSDLAQPDYRDAVTMPDPALSGATLDLVLGLAGAQGDGAWALFQSLRDNGMEVSGPNAQALNPVLQGAKAAVFGGVDYVSYAGIAKGEGVEVIFPASGTVLAPRPMMLLKTSKQPEAARRFIDYVLSDAGQAAVADAWLMPARADVPAKRPALNELVLLPQADGAVGVDRAGVLARFAALFGKR